jgi:3'(2'), 5'-bisphosphate nucleotidase
MASMTRTASRSLPSQNDLGRFGGYHLSLAAPLRRCKSNVPSRNIAMQPTQASTFEQQAAIDAAGAAARVLLSALPKSDTDLHIAEKADGSLVSDADFASQQVIQEKLAPLGVPVLSEEAAAPAFEDRKSWTRFWLVDPLDGTESFLRSRSGFAVNIALCDETGPIFGVVADPLSNRMYLGGVGVPVQVAPLDGSAVRQIHPSPIQRPYRLVTSWMEDAKLHDLVPPHVDPADVVARPISGALKFCLLATGDAEIHARTGPYMEWDCAAGDAILRGMNIDVVDFDGARLKYNTPGLRVTGLRCSRV